MACARGDLEGAGDVRDAEPVARDGGAVEADPREGDVGLLLAREVDHAGDPTHRGLDVRAEAPQLREVGRRRP
jgi:hypothetical protein